MSDIEHIASEIEAANLDLKEALEALSVFAEYLEIFKFNDVILPLQRASQTLNDVLYQYLT